MDPFVHTVYITHVFPAPGTPKIEKAGVNGSEAVFP